MRLPAALCVFCWLLAGCAGRLVQVPEDQPHGVVRVRIVHSDREMSYQDQIVLDDRAAVSLKREASVRVRPGAHTLTLHSFGEVYAVQLQRVIADPVGTCVDASCTRFAPRWEDRYALVPQQERSCSQTLQLHVAPGQQSLALLIAGPGASCRACERSELSARSCP